MTDDEARKTYLDQLGATEGSHHGHPDFRIQNKIFATLRPDKGTSALHLPLELAEFQAQANAGRCKIVSRASGMGWLSVDLKGWSEKEIRPLAEVAAGLMGKK